MPLAHRAGRVGAAARPDGAAVEAVHWHRLVVDEVHELFAAPRYAKAVISLASTFCWGLSATPSLAGDATQNMLYWLLRRDKAHHPT